jgi:hypothetical protein
LYTRVAWLNAGINTLVWQMEKFKLIFGFHFEELVQLNF